MALKIIAHESRPEPGDGGPVADVIAAEHADDLDKVIVFETSRVRPFGYTPLGKGRDRKVTYRGMFRYVGQAVMPFRPV